MWTFYEIYEFFMNFNKEALTFDCKKSILYIEKGNWADTVAYVYWVQKIKKYCPFCINNYAKLYVNKIKGD